uniref:Protein Shroom3-like n=1 Tax=Phallusia mammillata TaxID=59560 RepID=A0A6F9DRJ3_9ASCI|nr:protein Shroom3-like [Phallusia mammillata]
MFEKLSHDAAVPADAHHQYSRGSREDLEKISRVRRTPSDDADRYSARDASRSPSYIQSGPNSRRSSFSPPPIAMDKNANIARSWRAGAYGSEENTNNRDSAKYKIADAKIVKTNFDGRRSDPKVPDPPQRDSSSIQAVKNYHVRPHSASSPDDRKRYSSSPDRHVTAYSPQHQASSYRTETSEPTSPPKSAERNIDRQPKTQGRLFGITSVGNSKQVKAFDQEKPADKMSSKSPPQSTTLSSTPPRYEHVKDSFSHYGPPPSGSDYVSRKISEHQKTASYSDPTSAVSEHSRGGSGESVESDHSDTSRGRGKYGAVWKTPQVHRRSKSSDIMANAIEAWSTHDPPPGPPKLTVFKPSDAEKTPTNSVQPKTRTPRPKSGEYDSTDNQPSILRSLQKSQASSQAVLQPAANYEMLWPAASAQKSPAKTTSPSEVSDKKPTRKSQRNWSYNEVDLDEASDDETFMYSQDIRGMQEGVLRMTSFKRNDLASPSLKSFDQKRNLFNLNQSTAQPCILHNRSRSHGNEIDESSEPISGRSSHKSSSDSLATPREPDRRRPNSAGVTRRRSSSFTSDDSDHFSPTRKQPFFPVTPEQRNRRISIDVKPDIETPKSGSKVDTRKLVIDYISNKNNRNASESSPSLGKAQYTSSTSIHTSHSDETEKRRREAKALEGRVTKTGSSGDLRTEGKPHDEPRGTPTSHMKPEHATSVRKLRNYSEIKAKFQKMSKSGTMISEDQLKVRSPSLGNLVDEGIEVQSPSHSLDDSVEGTRMKRDRSKSSPNIDPPANITSHHHDDSIHAPPRRVRTRQRNSNSSSASSATTISNLSSLSSVSTTSIGKFQVLDEINEQPGSPFQRSSSPSPPDEIVLTLSPLENKTEPPNETPVSVPGPKATTKSRHAFNTDTYRVDKRRKKPKPRSPREGDGESGDEKKHVSKVELQITSPITVMATEDTKKASDVKPLPQEPPKHVLDDKVAEIVKKVQRTTSFKKMMSTAKPMAPPPKAEPAKGAKEQIVKKYLERQSDLPLPPPPPPPEVPDKSETQSRALSPTSQEKLMRPHDTSSVMPTNCKASVDRETILTDTYKDETYLIGDSDTEPPKSDNNNSSVKPSTYENVHVNGVRGSYENVFKPIKVAEALETQKEAETAQTMEDKTNTKEEVKKENPETEEPKIVSSPPPEISPEPLLPDVSLLPASSLEQEHPDLTRDIMKVDKSLAQMLTTNNKKTLDYMTGVLPQPSFAILQEGMRYRLNKPTKSGEESRPTQITTDISHESLPASSTYYKTSASKGKILSMVKEKMAGGEFVPDEDQEEINRKKMELVLSIKQKLDDLHSMKDLLEVEMRENECLGKQVFDLTTQVCTSRELEKYNSFVMDVDRIINLLLSLSARLARVENAIQMMPKDAEKQEMEQLCEKRKKLTEQHVEAKQLKENIDRRQKTVSEILARYFNHEQFADYEHYIKMKSALIMEQRELLDKSKLGQEQMQCLRESLPTDWQSKLDRMLEEE